MNGSLQAEDRPSVPTEQTAKPVLAEMDRTHFTVVFRGDIRKLLGGPFAIKSDFGEPVSSGYGNAFTKADALEDALYRALPFIEDARDDPAYDRRKVNEVVRQIKTVLGEA